MGTSQRIVPRTGVGWPGETPAADGGRGHLRRRIASLDVARGLLLVAMIAINSWIAMPAWFDHAPWAGVHPNDLIFPTFVTLSGCALALAYRRRVPLVPAVRRAVVLVLAGLLINAVDAVLATGAWTWGTWRLPGVLQLFGALAFLLAILHLGLRSWWSWTLATVLLAVTFTAVLATHAAGCPTGALTPACNPSAALDPALFGPGHIYHQGRLGHDPEGVVAVLGALVAAGAGAALGHVLVSERLRGPRRVSVAFAVVTTFAVLAFATANHVPAMKRLWTPPLALGVAAATGLVLVLLSLLLDSPREAGNPRRPARLAAARDAALFPLVALGRNSLFLYVGSDLLVRVLRSFPRGEDGRPVRDSWAHQFARTAPGDLDPAAWLVLLALLAWTALACLLHARRVYLTP